MESGRDFHGANAFISKLNNTGSALVYSTYLGGSAFSETHSSGLAIDPSGNAYITGSTSASDFPVTDGAFEKTPVLALDNYNTNHPPTEGFVTKLNSTGTGLEYSTYFAGAYSEYDAKGSAIAVDAGGHAFIAGGTTALDFPTEDALQTTLLGGVDAFIAEFDSAGESLLYSTYLGGSDIDRANAIAVDAEGNAYVTGFTSSVDFPISDLPTAAAAEINSNPTPLARKESSRFMTQTATQPAKGGGKDVFVTKVPGCDRPDFKDTYPLDNDGQRALLTNSIGKFGNIQNGWSMQAGISTNDGLVLRKVKLGERLMAEQLSIPYLLIKTNKMTQPVRLELRPNDPKNGNPRSRLVFYKASTIRTNRLTNFKFPLPSTFENYNSSPNPSDDTAFVMATYMLENFSSTGACLKVVQRYEFDEVGGNCEPNNKLKCARFYPMVKYVFYGHGDEKLEYVNIVQRDHFSDEGKPKNVVGLFKDCDTPLICGGLIFSGKSNPVERETLFDPLFFPEGKTALKNGQPGSWDNYHHTYNDNVSEPTVTGTPGCPECIHVHWRWGKFATSVINDSNQFNSGNPIIPAGSKQSVDIALSVYKTNETHPQDYASVLNLEPLTYTGYAPPLTKIGVVFWYSGKSNRENDSFFIHGGFFNPEKANQVSINLGPAKLLIAHLYEEGNTTATLIPINEAGILPQGYTVYNGMAYDISTEAVVSGPHIVTFNVPTATDPAIFNRLRILHGEDGVLVDRTIFSPDNPGPDFAAKTISARVDSLSPFVIALVGTTSDTIAPVIITPANISAANTPNQCATSLNAGIATATDNVAVTSIVGVRSDNKLFTEPYPVGVTTITWTASDAAGNASSAAQTVTINDTQPPVLNVPAAITIATGMTTACNVLVSDVMLGAANASDNCSSVTVTRSGVPAGNLFPVGITTITYLAKDLAGNVTTATQMVTVQDKTAPVISCPANIVTEFTTQTGAIVNFALPIAADNCVGQVTVTSSKASGSLFPIGTTTVVLTATDAAGNKANCSFTVMVQGARSVKQNVLAEMTALKNTLTNQDDKGKLSEAITRLSNSLTASLWTDETHLKSKDSSSVFDEEKETVKKLMELIKSKKGVISDVALQGFINRLTRDDRQLAFVAIQEAITANGNANDIAKANDEWSKGDADVADNKYDNAIGRYLNAWKAARKAVGKA